MYDDTRNTIRKLFSIKDDIIIDFRAVKINSDAAKTFSANVIDYKGQKILKSVGLFEANASDKSNILKTLDFCQRMIV